MIRVMIESPFAPSGDRTQDDNVGYAIWCMDHSFQLGEAPFASHLLYPRVLNDSDPKSRERGLQAAYEWMAACDLVAFYVDHGWSPGMVKALKVARLLPKKVTLRHIFNRPPPESLDVRELVETMEMLGFKVETIG